MTRDQTTEQLRNVVAQYERNSTKTSWLLRQLSRKIRHFPRDLSRRLRRSFGKRLLQMEGASNILPVSNLAERLIAPSFPFHVPDNRQQLLTKMRNEDPAVAATLDRMTSFLGAGQMAKRIAEAAAFDPNIGELTGSEIAWCPPWHDVTFTHFRTLGGLIPPGQYDAVVLMPMGSMGGADLVAAVLAQTLAETERVLILRTDGSQWDQPDWYPANVPTVDLSSALGKIENRQRALYALLTEIAPKRIFNVNSRLAFDTFETYGARLATQFRLYAYYFCADRTNTGVEVGYPVLFFSSILPHLSAALIDTRDLAQTLINRYAIPSELAKRVVTLYTPAQTRIPPETVAERRISGITTLARERARILWGGRLDRQKRFDLVIEIARAMPDVDFLCWGKAVLDVPTGLDRLPANLVLNPPFKSYQDIPLFEADGWLYTSAWDGLPTILIELGALGVPIVATGVGGVPELIDDSTGWLVPEQAPVSAYVAALRAMIGDPAGRVSRARNLQQRVAERHSAASYARSIASI